MKFYTIKEIAKMAGVSAGTVDRVLHKRGKVSVDKENKVNEILKKIDYKPNELARSLKLNRKYRLVVLLPDDELDDYWKPCSEGISELKNTLLEKGIYVEVLKYDPANPSSFEKVCEKSYSLKTDGVLLGALFQKESKAFLNQLNDDSIPFVLFNAIVESTNYQSFIGQDLIQSGRTAAHLFDNILPSKKSLLIVHLAEAFENAFHMQQKEKGFRDYFCYNEQVDLKTINIKAEKELSSNQLTDTVFQEQVDGIFVTTSKAHLLVHAGLDVPIIGYDLIKENIECLKSGKINFLIYQNPKMQALQGLNLLVDVLTKSAAVPRHKYLPIEIISKENISSYLG